MPTSERVVGDRGRHQRIACLFLPGDATAGAEAWFKKDRDWIAPLLWRSEFRNVFGGYLRTKQLTFDAALGIQREAEALLLGSEHDVDFQRVPGLVRDSDCSACDCDCDYEFVSLAMRIGVSLLTADGEVLKAFPECTVAF